MALGTECFFHKRVSCRSTPCDGAHLKHKSFEPYRAEGQAANPGDSGRFVDWLVISIEIGIRPKPTRLRPCSLCTFLVETVPTSRLVT